MYVSTYVMIIIGPQFSDRQRYVTRISDMYLTKTFATVVEQFFYCHIIRNNVILVEPFFLTLSTNLTDYGIMPSQIRKPLLIPNYMELDLKKYWNCHYLVFKNHNFFINSDEDKLYMKIYSSSIFHLELSTYLNNLRNAHI